MRLDLRRGHASPSIETRGSLPLFPTIAPVPAAELAPPDQSNCLLLPSTPCATCSDHLEGTQPPGCPVRRRPCGRLPGRRRHGDAGGAARSGGAPAGGARRGERSGVGHRAAVDGILGRRPCIGRVVRETGDDSSFDQVARDLYQIYTGMDSLQLAPGGVLTRIYPLAGNEAAIGLDLAASPIHGADIRRRRRHGSWCWPGRSR